MVTFRRDVCNLSAERQRRYLGGMATKKAKKQKFEPCTFCGGGTKMPLSKVDILVACEKCLEEIGKSAAHNKVTPEKFALLSLEEM